MSFTPRSLYLRGKSHRYPLDRRLGGPGTGLEAIEKRKILPLSQIESEPYSLSLYGLSYPDSIIRTRRYKIYNLQLNGASVFLTSEIFAAILINY
jgi:hypothetical protein